MEMLKTKTTARIIVLTLLITMIAWLLPANLSQASAASYPKAPRTTPDRIVTWDCVYFGNYPQSSDGKGGFNNDPIKWRVLSVNGDDALLVADKNLDARAYNQEFGDITWEKSTVRSWLNGYDSSSNKSGINYTANNFKNKAFTAGEQDAIYEKEVVNEDNPESGIEGGNNTKDKVFLLSIAEVKKPAYGFPNHRYEAQTRESKNTAYVVRQGDMESDEGESDGWRLRSAGNWSSSAAYVRSNGDIDGRIDANISDLAIRPALHLDLSSNLWKDAGTVSLDGKANISNRYIGFKRRNVYTGKAQRPPVVVEDRGVTLKENVDYTLEYKNNVNIGMGQIIVKGIGDFTGTVTESFIIRPAKAVLTNVKEKSKALSAVVKKQKGGVRYEFSCKAAGGEYKVCNTAKSAVTFKNLKTGTSYSVSVRAYKVVNGKKLSGSYSIGKTVKVK